MGFLGDVVDWDCGNSGVEAKEGPWEYPGNERGSRDRGTVEKFVGIHGAVVGRP